MRGIEINRLLKADFGTNSVAGRLADHSHQTIGLGSDPAAGDAARRPRLLRRTDPGSPTRRPGPIEPGSAAGDYGSAASPDGRSDPPDREAIWPLLGGMGISVVFGDIPTWPRP